MNIDNIEYSNISENLWIDDSGDNFYYSFTVGEDKVEGKLDYSLKKWNSAMKVAVAKTAVSKLKSEHKQIVVKKEIITFDLLVTKSYRLDHKASFVQIEYYEKYIKEFIGSKNILKINSFDLKKVFDYQYSNGFKLSTLLITFDFLKVVFNTAMNQKIITDNPCRYINIQTILDNTYTKTIKDKLNEIYNTATIIFKDEPLYLAFILFLLHGKRKKDIYLLMWELIDFKNDSFLVKPGKKKYHYLHPTIKEELLKVKRESGFLYKSEIEVNSNNVEDIKNHFKKINKYIPDFSINHMEYLVEQLQERQVFGDDYSSYKASSQPKPKREQRLIGKSRTIKPKLNIGKFSKKT
ncbi:MAG: phage integrase SAM-like domain-containing protein [Campylobacterota bacterium]|nr:phage integrase SAM-like domain-containing protein [Campylobacterota bacterium]